MISASHLAITLLLFSVGTNALQNSFLGCYSAVPGGPNLATSLDQTSSEGCASYCETNAPSTQPTFTYSYFTAAEDQMSGGTAPICRCYTAHPAYPAIANSAAGSTVCDNNQAYSVLRIQTAFTYNGCYQGTPSGASASAGDDGDCFAICGTSTMVAAYFDAMDSKTGTCYCDATPPSDRVPSSCGETNGFFYSRTAAAVASGVYRRNQRMAQRAAQAQAAENKYCPAKYLPCKILGTGSYECIDPSTELESCGGCVHGVFGKTSATAAGTDCSSLPGAPMSSYTCYGGLCKAAVCERGWRLNANGICLGN